MVLKSYQSIAVDRMNIRYGAPDSKAAPLPEKSLAIMLMVASSIYHGSGRRWASFVIAYTKRKISAHAETL